MGKIIKYIFELKLKFLKFLNLHGVMSPPTFPQKWIIRGGHDSEEYGIYNKNNKTSISCLLKCELWLQFFKN